MNTFRASLLGAAIFTGSATLLTACGGGGGDNISPAPTPTPATETVSGTAATGKAFPGTIVIVNQDGKASNPVAIKTDGTFAVVVPKGAPYLIKASNGQTGAASVELYSFLADAAKHINVTQLTTQAVYDANGKAKLADLYSSWAIRHTDLTQAKIDQAAKKVAANLNFQLAQAGLNPKSISLFNDTFLTNSTGLDKVLDQVKISYSCNIGSCNVTYIVNGFSFQWNDNIDVTGYNIVITPPKGAPTGKFDLKVTSDALGPNPVIIKNVPKATTKAEFCTGTDTQGALPANIIVNSCDYNTATSIGVINATVTTNGTSTNYTVNYEYVPAT